MRRLLLALVTGSALAVAGAAPAATISVRITKSGFNPNAVTINFGDTVAWHNSDSASHHRRRRRDVRVTDPQSR